MPPRLTWTAGEREGSRANLAAGCGGKAMAVSTTATANANGLTVTQSGQWSDGACLPEPPLPGTILAPYLPRSNHLTPFQTTQPSSL